MHPLERQLKSTFICISHIPGNFRKRHVGIGEKFFGNENALAGNDAEDGLSVGLLKYALQIGGRDVYKVGNLRNADFFGVIFRNIEEGVVDVTVGVNPVNEKLIAAADFDEKLKQPDFVFDFKVFVADAVLLGIYELDKLVQRFKNRLRVVKDKVFPVR